MIKIRKLELAWAAGFFDGEGTACLRGYNNPRYRPNGTRQDYISPSLAVAQSYDPETLHRFQRAVGGLGKVQGPHSNGPGTKRVKYQWRCDRPHEVIAVIALLWRFLSTPKREQIAESMKIYLRDVPNRRPYRIMKKVG